MAQTQPLSEHKLTLHDRQKLTMTGVTEILSFDDTAVALQTQLGMLTVHGQQLQLKTLSVENGQVDVQGQIQALIYEENQKTGGFWRRLLG